MQVGPPTHDHYLGIAWIAQVGSQLPLSGPVPAHVKEYLDDDEYDDNSEEETNTSGGHAICISSAKSTSLQDRGSDSHVPVQLHFHGFLSHWAAALIAAQQLADSQPEKAPTCLKTTRSFISNSNTTRCATLPDLATEEQRVCTHFEATAGAAGLAGDTRHSPWRVRMWGDRSSRKQTSASRNVAARPRKQRLLGLF